MNDGLIHFLIMWVPSLLFIFIIVTAIIWGMIRGFRKSLILAIQAAIIFIACIIIYITVVNIEQLDSKMYNNINHVLNSMGVNDLPTILSIDAKCNGLKDVIAQLIIKNVDYGTGFELVVKENGAYLATIVNIVYHILFAFLIYYLYLFLIFIMYIIYIIFYPERRYKRKRTNKYQKGSIDKPYSRHFLLGGVVGAIRGGVYGLIVMSFIGSLFFIIGGGVGERKYQDYEDVDFKDQNSLNINNLNLYYEIYKNINSYGSNGIFKVLNLVKDKNDVPYYLYAADLVLQGGLSDEELGIEDNIYLRQEIGAYTEFASNTFNLLMKYGSSQIVDYINKQSDKTSIYDVIIEIMKDDNFQTEFEALINDFDAQTYFINFGLSLLNSLVYHINDINVFSNLDPVVKDIITILFTSDDGFKIYNLLNKNDVTNLVSTVLNLISLDVKIDPNMDQTQTMVSKVVAYGDAVVEQICNLSVLNEQNKAQSFNRVLENLYNYFANTITLQTQPQTISTLALKATNLNSSQINWIEELKSLLNVGLSSFKLADRVFSLGSIFTLFKDSNPNLQVDEVLYDEVLNGLGDSKLLAVVLSLSKVKTLLYDIVYDILPNATIPSNIEYANVYDDEGNLVSYGEIYNLFSIIKTILKTDGGENLFKGLANLNEDTIKEVSLLLNEKVDDNLVIDELLKSKILRYSLSSLMLDTTLSNNLVLTIYVPAKSTYLGDDDVILINDDDLKKYVTSLPSFIDIIKKDNTSVNSIVYDDQLLPIMADSCIIEGTISKLVLDNIKEQDAIDMPKSLLDVENWLSIDNNNGEIIKMILGIRASNIDVDSLNIANITLNNEAVETMLNSSVLYFTVSKQIINTLNEADMPLDAFDEQLEAIEEKKIVSKSEILNLFNALEGIYEKPQGIMIGDIQFDNLVINQAKLNLIYNSYIAYKKVTDALENALDNDIPEAAYNDMENKYYILENEINILLNIAGNGGDIVIGGDNETDLSITTIYKSQFSNLANSYIIRYKISKKLIENENVAIPSIIKVNSNDEVFNSLTDKDLFIEKTEFLNFLNAFSAAYGDADGNIELTNAISVTMPDQQAFNEIVKSVILRATITKNIKFEYDGVQRDLYIEDQDLDLLYTDMAVISEEELYRALVSISILNPTNEFVFTLDLMQLATTMTKYNIYEITKSNIIRLAMNDLILDMRYNIGGIEYSGSYSDIFVLTPTVVIYDNNMETEYSLVAYDDLVYGKIYKIDPNKISKQTIVIYNLNQNSYVEHEVYVEVDNNGNILSTTTQNTLQAYFAMLDTFKR